MDLEVRVPEGLPFGRGRKRRGTFGEVLQAAQRGDDGLYLTTQRAEVEADGFPAVLAPPLTALRSELPLLPALLGHLVPQVIT